MHCVVAPLLHLYVYGATPFDAFAHNVTGTTPLHTVRVGTVTVILSNVIFTWSLTGGHGPAGSFVVRVSVTLPAAISPAVGV